MTQTRKLLMVPSVLLVLVSLACGANGMIDLAENEQSGRAQSSGNATSSFSLGVAYMAPHHVGGWVAAFHHQRLGLEDNFRRDLQLLAAMGVRYLKVGITPHWQGFEFREGQRTQIDWAKVKQVNQNLIRILSIAKGYGMKVALTFMFNDLYVHGPNGFVTKPIWYKATYDNFANGPELLAQDVVAYETAIVNAIKGSSVADAVIYYNLLTEARLIGGYERFELTHGSWTAMMERLITSLVTKVPVPAGKLCLDVQERESLGHLRRLMDAAKVTLDYTEVHSYPNGAYGDANSDLIGFSNEAKRHFPNTTLVLGEFGISGCKTSNQAVAASRFRRIVLDAKAARIPFGFNWGLYDGVPTGGCDSDSSRYGLGFGLNDMRDIYGAFIDGAAHLPHGDFESSTAGWFAEKGASLEHVRGQSAHTGAGLLRFRRTGGAQSYFCSPALAVFGNTVATHFYARTSHARFYLQLHHTDAVGWKSKAHGILTKTVTTPTTSGFFSLAGNTDNLLFALPANTTQARLCILIPAGQAGTFDLDSFALSAVDRSGSAAQPPPGKPPGSPKPPPQTYLRPTASTAGSTSSYRVTIFGRNIYPKTCINARIEGQARILSSYCHPNTQISGTVGGDQSVSFTLQTSQEKAAIDGKGLRFWLVNPGSGNWTQNGVLVRSPVFTRPTIVSGSYDDATHQVVLRGQSYHLQTCVNIRRDGQSEILAAYCRPHTTISGLQQSTQSIRFTLASSAERTAIRSGGLRFWLVNPGPQNWTRTGFLIR
jgi:hypothetical protein